ncbi:RHS repeat-associated core domain-containing protein, partial [Flavobacterium sp. ST-75]
PFGEMLVDEHINSFNTPFKFNGKEYDEETGNYYYGARYYDPKWSMFIGVDPLADKYPDWSSYAYCFNNPIRYVDPDGRAPEDIIYVNAKGGVIKVVKDGSAIITIVDADGNKYSPSTLDSNNTYHRKIMASVAGHYRTKMGIDPKYKTAAGPNPEGDLANKNPAFTSHNNNHIVINTQGGFNKHLDDANNLMNVIKHENLHQVNNEKGITSTIFNHADVYLGQFGDDTFKNTTPEFKLGQIHSFANYLLNLDRDPTVNQNHIVDKIDAFNKLKTGYYINNPGNFKKGQLNLKIYHGKDVYKVKYEKVDN